ncbi:MAG: hypothetical protein IPI50_06230 [Saprospiraceae bacterium]|nr:hypothetical protein [Saprospiraceae bacterium]
MFWVRSLEIEDHAKGVTRTSALRCVGSRFGNFEHRHCVGVRSSETSNIVLALWFEVWKLRTSALRWSSKFGDFEHRVGVVVRSLETSNIASGYKKGPMKKFIGPQKLFKNLSCCSYLFVLIMRTVLLQSP